jgi:transposase-like protein
VERTTVPDTARKVSGLHKVVLTTFINTLMSEEANTVCGAEYGTALR